MNDHQERLQNMERLIYGIMRAAAEAYRNEIIDTQMECDVIGPGKEYPTKEDWIDDRINEWLFPDEEYQELKRAKKMVRIFSKQTWLQRLMSSVGKHKRVVFSNIFGRPLSNDIERAPRVQVPNAIQSDRDSSSVEGVRVRQSDSHRNGTKPPHGKGKG